MFKTYIVYQEFRQNNNEKLDMTMFGSFLAIFSEVEVLRQ